MGTVFNVEFGLVEGLNIGGIFGLDAGEVREQVELALMTMITGSAIIDGSRARTRSSR